MPRIVQAAKKISTFTALHVKDINDDLDDIIAFVKQLGYDYPISRSRGRILIGTRDGILMVNNNEWVANVESRLTIWTNSQFHDSFVVIAEYRK